MTQPAKINAHHEITETIRTAVWKCVCTELKSRVGDNAFDLWISPAVLSDVTTEQTTLSVPNEIYEVWINENYKADLDSALDSFIENRGKVEFFKDESLLLNISAECDDSVTPEHQESAVNCEEKTILRHDVGGDSETGAVTRSVAATVAQLQAPQEGKSPLERKGIKAGLSPKFMPSRFIIGENCKVAHAAATAVADKPATNYNPLFIYGEPGVGKSHLLNLIGWEALKKNPKLKILLVSANDFMNDFVDALQKNALTALRKRYRDLDILLVDDVQFFGGKFGMQDEFFHVFNAVVDAHKQLVMCSDRPANDIPEMERRLVTRFHWGMTATISTPDLSTRLAILRRKRDEWEGNLCVTDDQIATIANRFTSDVRLMEGALLQVATISSMNGGKLDEAALEETLTGYDRSNDNRDFSVNEVLEITAKHHDFDVRDLTSRGRTKKLAFVRQIAMFITRENTTLSLKEIGRAFGGRDHGTIIHGVDKIRGEIPKDAQLKRTIDYLTRELQQGEEGHRRKGRAQR